MVSVITLTGKNTAVDGLFGGAGDAAIWMAVGSSSSPPAEGSSALGSEHGAGDGYARINVTATTKYTYSSGGEPKKVTIEGTFDTTNITSAYTIREVALYDAETNGSAALIFQVTDIAKDDTKQVKFTIIVNVV